MSTKTGEAYNPHLHVNDKKQKDGNGRPLIGRAGLVVQEDGKSYDKFKVTGKTYLYAVPGSSGVSAYEVPAGDEVAINPVAPRTLKTADGNEPCVMAWVNGAEGRVYRGSGWIPISKLERGAEILSAAFGGAQNVQAPAGSGPSRKVLPTADHDTVAKGHLYVLHEQQGTVNQLLHYLPHDGRCYLNLNLPEGKAAPVVADVVTVGEHVTTHSSHAVRLFVAHAPKSHAQVEWVFVHAGHDRSRAGWIPRGALSHS